MQENVRAASIFLRWMKLPAILLVAVAIRLHADEAGPFR